MISLIAMLAAAALSPTTRSQLDRLAAAVAPYRDFAVAQRQGWTKFGGDAPLMGEHWSLPPNKGGIDYHAGQPIDFARPSNLMYTDIGGRRVLTGATFNVRLGDGEQVPDGFAGSADMWHVHDFRAAVAAATEDRPLLRWLANGWMDKNWGSRGRLAMVHVWVGDIPSPDGVFAHANRAIPYAKLGLPLGFASGASETAAKGLELATQGGCGESIDGGLWVANVSGRIKAQLHRACDLAAAHVRSGLRQRDKAEVNAMAEHGWAMFDAEWQRALTPRQRERIAAITEHGGADHGGAMRMDSMPDHPHPH